jgi:hypothetical protein
MRTIQSSALPQSSSLQRALATAVAAQGTDQDKKEGETIGAFENCFSKGLDLSEFTPKSNSDAVTRTASASFKLLRIKRQEQNKRRQEEQDDFKMEQMIEKRLVACRTSASDDAIQKNLAPASSPLSPVLDVLVQMHGGDETYKRTNSGKGATKQKPLLRKLIGSTKRQPTGRQHTSKERFVAKKSRRSKY